MDYETTSGSLRFQPGNTSFTFLVKICGDTSAEANETFIVTLSSPVNATVSSTGLGIILDDDVLELLVEESGPTVNQAAALDQLLHLRDPFRIVSIPDGFATGPDRNPE